MSKHTPGQWVWHTSNSWKRLVHERMNGDMRQVLYPYVRSDGHPDVNVSDADMRVIAVSPEMLDELKETRACFRIFLEKLEHETTGQDPKTNGYAYAKVPEWFLRQRIYAWDQIIAMAEG
jgi:hypothetical protein